MVSNSNGLVRIFEQLVVLGIFNESDFFLHDFCFYWFGICELQCKSLKNSNLTQVFERFFVCLPILTFAGEIQYLCIPLPQILWSIFLIPFIILYGIAFVFLFPKISLNDAHQLSFWMSFGLSSFLIYIFPKPYFLISFVHEFTHSFWAWLTFNKPSGFHVHQKGGHFDYYGRRNIMITLSPYFFHTLSILFLPFHLIIKEEFYIGYFIVLGIFTGFHTISIKEDIHPEQDDFRKNSFFLNVVVITLGNIISYGMVISFTLNSWEGIGEFLIFGLKDSVEIIWELFK